MAGNSTVAAMTAASALDGTELLYSVQGGADRKATALQVKTYSVGAGSVAVASGKTLTVSNSGTLAGGDAFVLAIAAGKTLTSSVTMTLQGGDASVLSIAAGKTLTASNSLTFTGTDSTSFAFPNASDTVVTLGATQTLTNKTLTAPVIGAATGTSLSVTAGLTARSGTATPAAASAVAALSMGSAAVAVYWGTGDPNTALTAPKGSLFIRTDGSGVGNRMYINTDAATAWAAFTTAG